MIVKISYLSLFLLGEKMQKFFLKSQLSYNSQTSKTTICKNVLQNRTKYLNCSQSKKRQLQGLKLWPSNLQLCTLTSRPRRQLNRSCFFHRHYLQLAPSTLWFHQSKELLYESAFSKVLSTWVYLISILLFFSKECTPVSR